MDSDDARRMNAIEARLAVIEQHLGISHAAGVTISDGTSAPPPGGDVMSFMQAGKMLKAIAAYRAQTGCTLDQARQVLEAMQPR
jgi:hypothetical protein